VLFVLVAYRLLAPGSEWRLHRGWFQRSALADLLGEDAGLAEIHKLYRCHDRLLAHKQAVRDAEERTNPISRGRDRGFADSPLEESGRSGERTRRNPRRSILLGSADSAKDLGRSTQRGWLDS
jgi:hypothetical protein